MNTSMIQRHLRNRLLESLASAPAVALLGPRQVGKTTLALEIGETRPSIYLDLESNVDRAKLSDPEAYLSAHESELVILDEVHRAPELFQQLRGLIDQGRRRGRTTGRFLLLGSASLDLADARVVGGVTYLGAVGLIAPARVAHADLVAGLARAFAHRDTARARTFDEDRLVAHGPRRYKRAAFPILEQRPIWPSSAPSPF